MMNTLKCLALAALMLIAPAASAANMGTSAGFDLDALLATARSTYDLTNQDAVVLLEDREVLQAANGDIATIVHRVVWIGSSVGIRSYADLRVPWNQANSQLDVEVLRTWRDGRWWPDAKQISETAVVETLPYAVSHADDYTRLRETMLLHDGIELPCVVETRYIITRQNAPAASGVFVFPQRDPTVQARLAVTTPAGSPWHVARLNGAPTGVVTSTGGVRKVVWDMKPAGQLGLPVTAQPAAFEPAIAYSTWQDWETVGAVFLAAFDAAAHIGPALTDSVISRTEHLTDPVQKVQAVLDFVEESTRNIRSDWRLWDVPRSADRTWETGYGNPWDRVVLAAGALRSLAVVPTESGPASLSANPVFLGEGTVAVAPSVPRLDDGWELVLNIMVGDGEFLTWRHGGALHGVVSMMGRPSFVPFTGQPVFRTSSGVDNLVSADLKLTPTVDEGWSWSGTMTAQGDFSPHGAIYMGQSLSEAAEDILGDVLPDADLDACTPRTFTPMGVSVACEGALAGPEADDSGTVRLTVGDPGDGVLGHLPRDIHLYENERTSAIMLPAMAQDITVRLPLDGFTVVHLPENVIVDNAAGHCTVSAKVAGGWLVYRRSVSLTGKGPWPELRAVLLEAQEGRNRDIVLKAGDES